MNTEKLPIIYEDDDFLVVNKPAGLLTHSTGHGDEPSVADFARSHTSDSDAVRPGIVHRLDRDTSGLLIIAKNTESKKYIQDQFRNRSLQKTYLALVKGRLKHEEAVIRLPIGHSGRSVRQTVNAQGQPAETWYRVLEELPGASLVEVKPKTGRTHQIRVHLAHLGHPIVGDELYGQPDKKLHRHFLHAAQLEFTKPDGNPITVVAELPTELKNYLDNLRNSI